MKLENLPGMVSLNNIEAEYGKFYLITLQLTNKTKNTFLILKGEIISVLLILTSKIQTSNIATNKKTFKNLFMMM